MDVNKERRRYIQKLRALENKKLQLKQQFERIDHKLDVIDPMIEAANDAIGLGDEIPALEIADDV